MEPMKSERFSVQKILRNLFHKESLNVKNCWLKQNQEK